MTLFLSYSVVTLSLPYSMIIFLGSTRAWRDMDYLPSPVGATDKCWHSFSRTSSIGRSTELLFVFVTAFPTRLIPGHFSQLCLRVWPVHRHFFGVPSRCSRLNMLDRSCFLIIQSKTESKFSRQFSSSKPRTI